MGSANATEEEAKVVWQNNQTRERRGTLRCCAIIGMVSAKLNRSWQDVSIKKYWDDECGDAQIVCMKSGISVYMVVIVVSYLAF
jgi:hypothetical protein